MRAKTVSLDFTEPPPSLVRSDSVELRKQILELTQREATELGINKIPFYHLRKHANGERERGALLAFLSQSCLP
jgi:hypothetical protein